MPETSITTIFEPYENDPEFKLEADLYMVELGLDAALVTHGQAIEALERVKKLARLGAAVEAKCKEYSEKEKIKCCIAIMNLVFKPE